MMFSHTKNILLFSTRWVVLVRCYVQKLAQCYFFCQLNQAFVQTHCTVSKLPNDPVTAFYQFATGTSFVSMTKRMQDNNRIRQEHVRSIINATNPSLAERGLYW